MRPGIVSKNFFLKRCREGGTSSDYWLKHNPVPEIECPAPDAELKEQCPGGNS